MKLYYAPMTRAGRVRWLLEELEVPFELVRLDTAKKENRQPPYLALNPLGHVPTLVDDDVVVYESAAILMYLADKYIDKGFAPPFGSPLRARYYQWMVYVPATVELPLQHIFNQNKLPEAERNAGILETARTRFRAIATAIDGAIGGHSYAVGDRFTAADIMLAAGIGWARGAGLVEDFPRLKEYGKRMAERPAAKRARAD